jgi:hypothetical protein
MMDGSKPNFLRNGDIRMMNSSFRRATSLLILVTVTGCSTMRPVAQPREFMRTRKPGTIWVTRQATPAMFEVSAPQLVGDSLVGFVEGEYVEIPFNQVEAIQAKQYSRGRTMTFILGITAATVGFLLLMGGGLGAMDYDDGEGEIGMLPPVDGGAVVEQGLLQVV